MPSTRTLEYESDVVTRVTAPLRDLQPLGWQELLAAHRQGRDPNKLVAAFWDRYDEAFAESNRRAYEGAKRLGVPPVDLCGHVIDAAGELCQRTPSRMTRWGVVIPRGLERPRWRDHFVPPPPRSARARSVKRRPREVRTSTPSRGDPGDDDPEPAPEQLQLDPAPARRLYDRAEIKRWIAEQMASLDRLRAS